MTETTLRIAIVIGSTRPGSVGGAVGRWALDIAPGRGDAVYVFEHVVAWSNALRPLREPTAALHVVTRRGEH